MEQDKLLASDAAGGALQLGYAVAVDGNVLIAGAPYKSCATGQQCGAAYIFRFDGATWIQEQIITSPSPGVNQRFGSTVSISGNVAMVDRYVFRFDGSSWVFERKLIPPECADTYTTEINGAVYGDAAIIGIAHCHDTNYGPIIFRFDGSQWVMEHRFPTPVPPGYVVPVALGDGIALTPTTDVASGSVSVFRFNGSNWAEEHRFLRPAGTNASFGDTIALDGNVAIVGGSTNDDTSPCPGGNSCGVAYAYRFDGLNWSPEQRIVPSYRRSGDYFGSVIFVKDDLMAVGANQGSSASYVFRSDGISWTEQGKLRVSDYTDSINSGYFSGAVAINDDSIFLGFYGYSACRQGHTDTYCGSVCRYPVTVPTRARSELQGLKKPRSVTFFVPCSPSAPGTETALRVRLVSLNHPNPPYAIAPSIDLSASEGEVRWVGPPQLVTESETAGGQFWSAQLQCTPYYYNWSNVDLLQLTGSAIVPSSMFEIQNVAPSCAGAEENCPAVSSPIQVATGRWGDVASYYADQPGFEAGQPNILDVVAVVDKFRDLSGAAVAAMTDLAPVTPDRRVDVQDIVAAVDAFRGLPYSASISVCP